MTRISWRWSIYTSLLASGPSISTTAMSEIDDNTLCSTMKRGRPFQMVVRDFYRVIFIHDNLLDKGSRNQRHLHYECGV